MRIVTLEEHCSLPEMTSQLPAAAFGKTGGSVALQQMMPKLADITGERLKLMDEAGITLQVLSVDSFGSAFVSPEKAPAFAAQYNDLIAQKIAGHRGRFTAFAHLPMTAPAAAADELERTVREYGFCGAMIRGTIDGRFLDAPEFAPIFSRAERLGVPLYLHPGLPPGTVADAYYSNVGTKTGVLESLACWGWGWHAETAVHVLRLLAAGIFDTYPKLKIIIGHMGEMLPMMWARADRSFKPGMGGENQRSLADTFHEQLHITTSGFFTQPPLRIAIDTFGIDNIMFSVDYPFSTNQMGIDFLYDTGLPQDDLEKLAYANADRLLGLSVGG